MIIYWEKGAEYMNIDLNPFFKTQIQSMCLTSVRAA